ncbi:MAG: Rrf2 family transcriptional regulator [Deltaproteobacteria bacterium]|nr:Rrf2 family transcriptional regulator [Deltaproteobacteria bacterium]
MILSQTAQYALRIMTHISLVQGARPVRAKEIAMSIRSPSPYVSKVLRKLVTAGLLRAERGHGGGFVLARPAEKILFCHVLEAVQPVKEVKQCIFGWRKCNPDNPCILHHRWNAVSSSFEEWARHTSLADIQNDAVKSDWLTRVSDYPK